MEASHGHGSGRVAAFLSSLRVVKLEDAAADQQCAICMERFSGEDDVVGLP